MPADKRILITGGRGFIGSALASRLAKNNYVMCYDITQGDDILDKEALTKAVTSCDIIIHTAARLGVANILDNAVNTLQINYTGTANLFQVIINSNTHPDQVICFSTSEIYGTNTNKVSEHGTPTFPDATDPRWCYGVGKLAAEHLALGYYNKYGVPVTIVRPFNVFGEGRVGNYALLHFIQNAINGTDLVVYGDGLQVRAWCHIEDFCDAIMAMLDRKASIGQAFNIGNPGNAIIMDSLARRVVKLCKSRSKIVYKPATFTDIRVRIPDISLAQSVLGYKPKIKLDDGLRRTIDWSRNEHTGISQAN